ncbi:MAG: hypothetical protein QXW80_00860 [Candidatus Micrarchaeia archaeon]
MGIIDLLKGFVIGILVLILMAALPSYIIMNTIQSNLLDQKYYETQFEKTGMYIKIQNGLLNMISSQIPASQLTTYGITETDLKNAMSKSITKEWVKGEVDRNIRNLMWYLNDETKGVNLSISLKPKIAEGIANLIIDKIGLSQSAATSLANELDIVKSIPDPLDVEQVAPGTKQALVDLKNNVLMFKNMVSQLFIVILVIVVIIFILTLNLKDFAKTLGWPLLITGILISAGSFFLPNVVKDAVSGTGVTSSQQLITMTNIIDFLSPIFGSILAQGLMIFGAGIILIAFSFIYPMIEKKEKK